MSRETTLVWFREDLRVHDNATLAEAADGPVVPVYCFDPRAFGTGMFDLPKTGPHRTRFLVESVRDLRESMRDRGGELLVREGEPETVLPELADAHDVGTVHFHRTPATEETEIAASVTEALDEAGVDSRSWWGKTLYHIDDLPEPVGAIDDTFTSWRKAVEDRTPVRERIPAPEDLTVPEVDPGQLPTPADLGFEERAPDERGVLPFDGGESAGKERVEEYLWENDCLREYKETRNGLVGADYSSKFSAWLALGCLSPRYIHGEVKRYEADRVSNESTYWLVFELLWRDFMTFQFEKHGERFFAPGGIQESDPGWRTDREAFERWARGETGVPFVDANMRELNETGYMSNRGRQNVASFLADWLGLDWRLGAAYFEAKLVDYDVCSNWGNWAYQAGVGNDSRNNYFNVRKQAKQYDPEGAYVRRWIPELSEVDEAIHEPWTLRDGNQESLGDPPEGEYPAPMIDVDATHARLRDRS